MDFLDLVVCLKRIRTFRAAERESALQTSLNHFFDSDHA
jgi:hypothetical protein